MGYTCAFSLILLCASTLNFLIAVTSMSDLLNKMAEFYEEIFQPKFFRSGITIAVLRPNYGMNKACQRYLMFDPSQFIHMFPFICGGLTGK